MSGRGEEMRDVTFDLSGYYLVLIFSNMHISTAKAIAELKPGIPGHTPADIVANMKIESWKDKLTGDFEAFAYARYPELKHTKDKLYDAGALYASITGFGSAVYGIFKSKPDLTDLAFPQRKCWFTEL